MSHGLPQRQHDAPVRLRLTVEAEEETLYRIYTTCTQEEAQALLGAIRAALTGRAEEEGHEEGRASVHPL
jgi:hypothetical protein